ncbi:hypothetical protein D3C83_88260 [compost metagenome]
MPLTLANHLKLAEAFRPFDLAAGPDEKQDLVEAGRDAGRAGALEAKLRAICDLEAMDARAKADQRRHAEAWGGREKLLGEDNLIFSPPPGVSKEEAWRMPARS